MDAIKKAQDSELTTQDFVLALLSVVAAYFVIGYDTPIDHALPFCAIVIVIAAFIAERDEILVALPLLFACEVAIDDERTRLLAIGIVVAASIAAATLAVELTRARFAILGVMATLVLRWVPISDVLWAKELLILAGVVALLMTTTSRTPASLAIVIAIALATPAYPGRMVFYPAAVAMIQLLTPFPLASAAILVIAAIVSRYSLVAIYTLAALAILVGLKPDVRRPGFSPALLVVERTPGLRPALGLIGFLILALWPWSGMTARLLPLPITRAAFATRNPQPATEIGAALESSQSVDVDLPRNVRHIVMRISGANMAHMRPRREVGVVEVGGVRRVLRIGDIADFGFMRREQFFFSLNVPPRNSCGDVRGYGNTSFQWGAGCIAISLDRALPSLRVIAANDLPAGAKLQVESIEYDAE